MAKIVTARAQHATLSAPAPFVVAFLGHTRIRHARDATTERPNFNLEKSWHLVRSVPISQPDRFQRSLAPGMLVIIRFSTKPGMY
jgi:hypothetical protein